MWQGDEENLFLHEKEIPEESEHLKKTWDKIITDDDHHLIVYEIDGKIVSLSWASCQPKKVDNILKHAI